MSTKGNKNILRPLTITTIILALCLVTVFQVKAATKAPHFALPTVVGEDTIDLKAQANKVVLLNFFATWCPPCRKEIKSLIELQKEFGPKQFTVIGLSMDDGSSRAKIVSKFIEKHGINYPVALATEQVARDFGDVRYLPQSFLIDQQGNVVKSYPGYFSHQVFKQDIEAQLK